MEKKSSASRTRISYIRKKVQLIISTKANKNAD